MSTSPTQPLPGHPDERHSSDPAMPSEPGDFRQMAIRNAKIGAILALGAALTVSLSYLNLGSMRLHVTLALLIAVIQAGCVALISMHLKGERGMIVRSLLLTGILVAALIGLSLLGFSDRAHY